jgi:hypothetical protein
MAEISKPSDINKVWSSGGVKVSPSDAKIIQGWIVEEPPREYFNWLDNKQDQAIAHNNQHGMNLWDAGTPYIGGRSWVQGSNGCFYICKVDNTGTDPVSDLSETVWHKTVDSSGAIAASLYSTYFKTLLGAFDAYSFLGLIGAGTAGRQIFASATQVDAAAAAGIVKATDTEANTATDDNKYLTPKKLKLGFSSSLGSNGYIAFPTWLGGFRIQWGQISADKDNDVFTSLSFPTNCFAVNVNYAQSIGRGDVSLSAFNITKNGFTTNFHRDASGPSIIAVSFIAIGN